MPGILSIEKLRRACNLLLDEVEQRFGAEIHLDAEGVPGMYWSIDLGAAYSMVDPPEVNEAGDFREDASEVAEILDRETGEIFLWHDLDHMSGLLRGLAFMDLPPDR